MASALDRDKNDSDGDSDSEFGYDLSLEDEKVLASLADGADAHAHPHPTGSIAPATRHHAANNPRSSQGGKTALVGVARTNSVDVFMRRTQPQSTPSVVPVDDVQYPDCRWLFLCHRHFYVRDDSD